MIHKVTFLAEMDEEDVGAMNEYFKQVMEEEMHINPQHLRIEQVK